MKKSKIILAAAALVAALTFTSCNEEFGKDDFFGTWHTKYTVTNENFLPASDPASDGTDKSGQKGSTIDLTMYFDGKTETLFNKSGSKFYQFRIRTQDGETKASTFWCGTYELSDNQNYSKGTLTLDYKFGASNVSEAQAKELAELWTSGDFKNKTEEQVETALKAKCNNIAKVSNPDIESFTFELSAQTFTQGYTKMSATAKSKCSWEVKNRSFDLQSTSSGIFGDFSNFQIPNGNNSSLRSAVPVSGTTDLSTCEK